MYTFKYGSSERTMKSKNHNKTFKEIKGLHELFTCGRVETIHTHMQRINKSMKHKCEF